MNSIVKIIFISYLLIFSSFLVFSQDVNNTQKTYRITKNDGAEYIGFIISQDTREVLIETSELGQMIIPKHEIRKIEELTSKESLLDEQPEEELFTTRYFITTNGFSQKKGESYIQWNLFGPDFQFAVMDNLGVGVMTTWLGMPIIGTVKYSFKLNDDVHYAVGSLLGTGTWAKPDFGIALPYGAVTFGNRRMNVNLSAGYGAVFFKKETEAPPGSGLYSENREVQGRFLLSVAAMAKMTDKFSFVFDTFIVPTDGNKNGFAFIIPGLRWQTSDNKAFQFGFAGISYDGEFYQVPFPMLQWFRKL